MLSRDNTELARKKFFDQFKEKVGIPVIVAECEGSGVLKALDSFIGLYEGIED